jgi:hypothetical protein
MESAHANGRLLESNKTPIQVLLAAADPDAPVIEIHNAQELHDIRNDLDGSYVLANDIDLSDFNGGEWMPIPSGIAVDSYGREFMAESFSGKFDGQGHVIRNLRITGAGYPANGLFSQANGAVIENLVLENSHIAIARVGETSVGALAGSAMNTAISNCHGSGTISSAVSARDEGYYSNHGFTNSVGGILGISISDGTSIENCSNASAVSALHDAAADGAACMAGGIAGLFSNEVVHSFNEGAVYSNGGRLSYAGGILGQTAGGGNDASGFTIRELYNTGSVTAISAVAGSVYDSESYAGGIAGFASWSFQDCYNTGQIAASGHQSTAGGIVGFDYYEIANCYNSGNVSATSDYPAPDGNHYSVYARASGIRGTTNNHAQSSIKNCVVLSGSISFAAPQDQGRGRYIGYIFEQENSQEVALYENNLAMPGIAGNSADDSNQLISHSESASRATYEGLGWDFGSVWRMVVGYDYPQLQWQERDEEPTPKTFSYTVSIAVGEEKSLADDPLPPGIPQGGQWVSDNAKVASLLSPGVICGVAPGQATVEYTDPESGDKHVFALTVTKPDPKTFRYDVSISVGEERNLFEDPLPEGVAQGGQWVVSENLNAVSQNSGVILGVAAGTTTIEYTEPESGDLHVFTVAVSEAKAEPAPPAEPEEQYGFRFGNNRADYGYPASGNPFSEAVYAAVFGELSAKVLSLQKTWPGGGNCFGVANTVQLLHDGALSLSDFSNYQTINSVPSPPDRRLLDRIEANHLTQFKREVGTQRAFANDSDKLSEIIEKMQKGELMAIDFYNQNRDQGHTVAGISIEPELNSNSEHVIHIYDNIYPNTVQYLYVKSDFSSWHYSKKDFVDRIGAVSSDLVNEYASSTEGEVEIDGKLITNATGGVDVSFGSAYAHMEPEDVEDASGRIARGYLTSGDDFHAQMFFGDADADSISIRGETYVGEAIEATFIGKSGGSIARADISQAYIQAKPGSEITLGTDASDNANAEFTHIFGSSGGAAVTFELSASFERELSLKKVNDRQYQLTGNNLKNLSVRIGENDVVKHQSLPDSVIVKLGYSDASGEVHSVSIMSDADGNGMADSPEPIAQWPDDSPPLPFAPTPGNPIGGGSGNPAVQTVLTQDKSSAIINDALDEDRTPVVSLSGKLNEVYFRGKDLNASQAANKSVEIKKGGFALSLSPQLIREWQLEDEASASMALKPNAMAVAPDLRAKLVSIDAFNNQLLNGIYMASIRFNSADAATTASPIKASVDLSVWPGMTAVQKSMLSGVRYDSALKEYIQLGGELSSDGMTFVFHTCQTGSLGLIITDSLQRLAFAVGSPKYHKNGVEYDNDAAPYLSGENRAMLPLRAIAEGLGAQVAWDEASRTVAITKAAQTITLIVNQPLPNGLGTPVILNSRTMVPIRYIAETLGANVVWDEASKTVNIYQ